MAHRIRWTPLSRPNGPLNLFAGAYLRLSVWYRRVGVVLQLRGDSGAGPGRYLEPIPAARERGQLRTSTGLGNLDRPVNNPDVAWPRLRTAPPPSWGSPFAHGELRAGQNQSRPVLFALSPAGDLHRANFEPLVAVPACTAAARPDRSAPAGESGGWE